MYRIGNGYDIHKLTTGRDLIIGGVKITHEKGLLGHSDADVLIHAITDAKYKDIDSTILLSHVYKLIKEKGYEISNLDSNIIAQQPKMMPYIPKMKDVLCKILEIDNTQLSIKAKTKEQLDSVGQGLAIEANVTVLLKIHN